MITCYGTSDFGKVGQVSATNFRVRDSAGISDTFTFQLRGTRFQNREELKVVAQCQVSK